MKPMTEGRIEIDARHSIRESEIEVRFGPSSGPGGQNVNRVATRVELRFDIAASSLDETAKQRLLRRLAPRLLRGRVLVVSSQRTRSQHRNRQDALERLVVLLRAALRPAKPRHPTAPTAASKQRRIEEKKQRSRLKRDRARPEPED